MDLLQTLVETLGAALRRIWPGVLGAALAGYLGWSSAGFWGFIVGAALGALAGTWGGARLGLAPVPKATGSEALDLLVYAAAAFLIVGVAYLALQFAFILVAIAVAIVIAGLWLSG